ncbi:MAG: hypothetical protein ACKOIZ_05025, partial [Actinomycetota bacterium]
LWSIYEKMVQKGREFDDIFDLMAIRIVVDNVRDCYAALGVIHGHWETGRRSFQGLHRDAEVQLVSVAAHHGDRAGRQDHRGADSHA